MHSTTMRFGKFGQRPDVSGTEENFKKGDIAPLLRERGKSARRFDLAGQRALSKIRSPRMPCWIRWRSPFYRDIRCASTTGVAAGCVKCVSRCCRLVKFRLHSTNGNTASRRSHHFIGRVVRRMPCRQVDPCPQPRFSSSCRLDHHPAFIGFAASAAEEAHKRSLQCLLRGRRSQPRDERVLPHAHQHVPAGEEGQLPPNIRFFGVAALRAFAGRGRRRIGWLRRRGLQAKECCPNFQGRMKRCGPATSLECFFLVG